MTSLRFLSAVLLGVILVYAWWRRRRTLRERVRSEALRVDDDAIRAIESSGRLVAPGDEPLDLEEIEEEERRFWEDEDWNPAERY